jgi:hypothetical protein
VWERRGLYRVLVGKLVGAEQVATQRRRKEDLGVDKWRAVMKKLRILKVHKMCAISYNF